jgi:hypothetical protein
MSLYVLTYDERAKYHNYKPLYDQLNSWGAAHLQNSVWLLENSSPAVSIHETMTRHMHTDDTACVIEIFPSSNWAKTNIRDSGLDWLRSHCKGH